MDDIGHFRRDVRASSAAARRASPQTLRRLAAARTRRLSVPLAHGLWLSQHLPRAQLIVRDGEGHFGIFEHLGEMLDTLTEPDRS